MKRNKSFEFVRPFLRSLAVLGAVAGFTTVNFRLLAVNSATAAFTYLLLILILATRVSLSISWEIIEAHGGHIWVQSESGKGAQFYLTLPVAAIEAHSVV